MLLFVLASSLLCQPLPPTYDSSLHLIHFNGHTYSPLSSHPPSFYSNLFISRILLILCGFSAGVGLGLLSIDDLNLEIMMINGSEEERRQVEMIRPVV